MTRRLALIVCLAGLVSLPAVAFGQAELLTGLGGPQGFGEDSGLTGDDNFSGQISIASIFGNQGLNFFGSFHSSMFINNNGNITFNAGVGPSPRSPSLSRTSR